MTPSYVMVYQSKHILKHNHYGITLDYKIKKKVKWNVLYNFLKNQNEGKKKDYYEISCRNPHITC